MAKFILILAINLIMICFTMQQNAQFLAFTDSAIVKSRILAEATKILINFNYAGHLSTSDVWEYKVPGTVYDDYIRLKDFAVKNITYDLSNSTIAISEFDVSLTGTNQISVTYTFSYNSKTSALESLSGDGEITVFIYINIVNFQRHYICKKRSLSRRWNSFI